MNKIVCSVEPGIMDQKVLFFQDEQLEDIDSVKYTDLVAYLINACYQKNCYNLHLVGNWAFLSGIVQGITKEEALQYSNNKIQMEIN